MELADDIAYGIHDIEDIVARRLVTREEVESAIEHAFGQVGGEIGPEGDRLSPSTVLKALFHSSYARSKSWVGS
jgi:dGTPase